MRRRPPRAAQVQNADCPRFDQPYARAMVDCVPQVNELTIVTVAFDLKDRLATTVLAGNLHIRNVSKGVCY